MTYDDSNNLLTSTNHDGHITRYDYYARGNRISENESMGRITRYVYDEENHLSAITVVPGSGYSYEYDDLYRLTRAAPPVGAEETFTYDKVGNRLQAVFNGVVVEGEFGVEPCKAVFLGAQRDVVPSRIVLDHHPALPAEREPAFHAIVDQFLRRGLDLVPSRRHGGTSGIQQRWGVQAKRWRGVGPRHGLGKQSMDDASDDGPFQGASRCGVRLAVLTIDAWATYDRATISPSELGFGVALY